MFGALALLLFKYISPQKAIGRAKNRVKGHLIEVRMYQQNLGLVTRAIGKVLWHNLRYLVLNIGPFVPLTLPFVLVAGQLVVRYGFDPVPVTPIHEAQAPNGLAGRGVTVSLHLSKVLAAQPIRFEPSEDLRPISPLVHSANQGRAFQEFAPTRKGLHELIVHVGGQSTIKTLWAGSGEVLSQPRIPIQPVRVDGWARLLWPAERGLGDIPTLRRIAFEYPVRDLGWLPGRGPTWVLIWFVLASLVGGGLAIRPLGVEI